MAPSPAPRPKLLRYSIAVGAPFLALAVRIALEPLLKKQSPLMLFILAGAVAAWRGGFGPGLLAFALGGALAMWVFIAPRWSLEVAEVSEWTRLVMYGVVGVVVSAISETLHRTIRRARERESELGKSEERYRAFVSTSHEAIWRIELDEPIEIRLPVEDQVSLYFERAYYAEVNDALARLYGFVSAAEVPGLRVRDVEPPTRMETTDSMRQFIAAGYRRSGEVSYERDRQGNPRNFLNNYVGIVEDGRLVRLWGSSLDITAHKRAEAALYESEATLKAFYESSPACMGMVELGDHDVFHLYDNPATCRIFGLQSGSTAGRWASEMGSPREVVEVWIERYRASAQANAPVTFDLAHDFPGQPRRWLASTVVPIPPGASGRARFCYVSLDVTARRDFEEELARAKEIAEAANRAKDNFIAALSHELRTPLNPVLLAASGVLSEPDLRPEERELWELVERNVSLQARLIDDLLDLTRIVRGKISLEIRKQDAHRLLRDALATVQEELRSKKQVLTLDLSATRTQIDGDAVRLQQVLWNVLKNAVKFTPEGGSVTVRSENPDGDGLLRIAVADNGIGLTADESARIFSAFVQGDHSQERGAHRFGGLGLGLAISQQLVHLHDGRIWAESAGRERGSTFFVELPLSS